VRFKCYLISKKDKIADTKIKNNYTKDLGGEIMAQKIKKLGY